MVEPGTKPDQGPRALTHSERPPRAFGSFRQSNLSLIGSFIPQELEGTFCRHLGPLVDIRLAKVTPMNETLLNLEKKGQKPESLLSFEGAHTRLLRISEKKFNMVEIKLQSVADEA